MKIKLLLTFDYELFFGENILSENEVLFNPTFELLQLLNRLEVKGVFFIDIMSMVIYNKYNKTEYVKQFKYQVEEIQKYGHEVQMHFHPHWIDSVNENGQWFHNYKNWSFGNLVENKGLDEAIKLFNEAYYTFYDLTNKKPIAYRAGGYTVEPYFEDLFKLLVCKGFKYDSSVVPYEKFISNVQYFDYLKFNGMNYWKFGQGNILNSVNSNEDFMYEFPISAISKQYINQSLFNRIKYFYVRAMKKLIKNTSFRQRGYGAKSQISEYVNDKLSITFDKSSSKDKNLIKFIIKEVIKKYKHNDELYLNIVSHPKLLYKESFDTLEWYIKYMKKEFNTKFIGFEDIKLVKNNEN